MNRILSSPSNQTGGRILEASYLTLLAGLAIISCLHWGAMSFDMRHVSYIMDLGNRISIGQWPSRDFISMTAPLSFSILGLAYFLFGASYKITLLTGGVLGAVVAIITYLFFRSRLGKPLAGLIALTTILYVYGPFGMMWYSPTAALFAYLALFVFAKEEGRRSALRAGILAALCFFAKQNLGGMLILSTLVGRWICGADNRNTLHYMLGAGGLAAILMIILGLPEGASPFNEYVAGMLRGTSQYKTALGWQSLIPYYGSFTDLLPYFILVGVLIRALDKRSAIHPGWIVAFSASATQIFGYYTSGLDITSRVLFTPLIAGCLLWIFRDAGANRRQIILAAGAFLYLLPFQFLACKDRRSLYGTQKTPVYQLSEVPSVPSLRESAYTDGLEETLGFCRQIPQVESLWCCPDSAIVAVLLKHPRPQRVVFLCDGYQFPDRNAMAQNIWNDIIQSAFPQWLVIQGGETFGLMSHEGGKFFPEKVHEHYVIDKVFGLFRVYRLKPDIVARAK